jgi:ADP-ribose pyrophosphatase
MTMELFVAFPFAAPEVLEALLGKVPSAVAARLPGHAPRQDGVGLRVALVADPDASAEGTVVACPPEAAARAAFVMGAFGAVPVPVEVETSAGPVEAVAHVAVGTAWAAGAAAAGSVGCSARQGLLARMVAEIAGHAGERAPAEMDALLHGIGFRALARLRGREQATPSRLRRPHGREQVEPVSARYGYARYFGVEEHRLRHRRFDGAMSGVLDRAVLASGDGVTVVPFDPHTGCVLLVEQFRAGAFARDDPNPWFLEAIAGRCDRLEPVELTARREALEEAGLTLGRLERAAAYYTSPGVAAEFITAFVGEADLSGAGGVFGLAEEGEDIRALVVPFDEALSAIETGEINNAPLMLTLMWIAQHRARLEAAWGGAGEGPAPAG